MTAVECEEIRPQLEQHRAEVSQLLRSQLEVGDKEDVLSHRLFLMLGTLVFWIENLDRISIIAARTWIERGAPSIESIRLAIRQRRGGAPS